MLLKPFLILSICLLFSLDANSTKTIKKDSSYRSYKNIDKNKQMLNSQKENLKNIKTTLSDVNKKNSLLKKLMQNQKSKLTQAKSKLLETNKSLTKTKSNLVAIQSMLSQKIDKLQNQQLLLEQTITSVWDENKNLKDVQNRVKDKELELVSLRDEILKQKDIVAVKDVTIDIQSNYIYMGIAVILVFVFMLLYMHNLRKKEKKTFKELHELKENLEVRVSEGIKEQQLLEDQKATSLSELIGNIAHQWRQPLNVISTVTAHLTLKTMIGKEIDKELFKRELANIDKHSQYLSKTIDIFRDYIKGEKKYQEIVLQDELEQAFMIASSGLGEHHVQIVNNIDYDNPITISLVTGELPQVIINIINNARDAMLHNKVQDPTVEYNLYTEDDKAIITIEDNGGGIPENIKYKIFEPYFTTKHKDAGTGLGLHMSYKIITQSLHGKIYVQNTENGAKFVIELPLKQVS